MSLPKLPDGELHCPGCGGIEFKHIENIEAVRNVLGYVDENGDEPDEDDTDNYTLKVEAGYKVNDEVGESNPRLWCCGCGAEYEAPEEVDFL